MNKPAAFSLSIPAHTVVGRMSQRHGVRTSSTVELLGECFIEGATREADGSYSYTLPGIPAVFFVAAGCCSAFAE